MRFVYLILTMGLLNGCTTIGLPEMMEKIGKDPATLCAKLIYGPAVITVQRSNVTTNGPAGKIKIMCKDDGMELEIEPLSSGLAPRN